MQRSAILIGVCLLAIALRLVVGATLLSQGGTSFVLASDDGDAYDAVGRLVGAAGAIVAPALLIGLPLVRYRVPADPISIIWMVAGVQALRGIRI